MSFFDSLSELRLLAQDSLRYRRQLLHLKQFFSKLDTTVLLVDDMTGGSGERDNHLHSLCHGVITLERLTLDFGAARRRMQVQKNARRRFLSPDITTWSFARAASTYFRALSRPNIMRPSSANRCRAASASSMPCSRAAPQRGTSMLVTGPAGSGKTSLALQYLDAACERGEVSVIYEFDERIGTMITRASAFGINLQRHIDSGTLTIRQMDPAEIDPGNLPRWSDPRSRNATLGSR